MDILRKSQKDECFLERIQHGETEFPFRFYREDVWEFDFHCIDWHWHPEVEFVYAERGSITCFIGTEQFILPQGCGLFVNSGALHRYQAEESVSVPNIVFSPELLGAKSGRIYRKYVNPIVESELTCILFCPSVDWQREILQCLLHIFHLQEGENAEMQTVAYLLELWHELFLHAQVRCGQKTGDRGRRAQLQVMMQFIHANHNRQITLKEIADSVHISESSALQLLLMRQSSRTQDIIAVYSASINGRRLWNIGKNFAPINQQ